MTAASNGREALDELYWRAEILQAMFWLRGEGLATTVESARLAEFLGAEPTGLARQLQRLTIDGYLERVEGKTEPHRADPTVERFALTTLGVEEGGRSFRDEFADYVRPAHGECGDGCWCKDPEHADDPCPNREPERARG